MSSINYPIEPVGYPLKIITNFIKDIFKDNFNLRDIPIYLLRIEIKVSDRENSDTNDPIYIQVGESEKKYYLNKGGDDFRRNTTHYYSIRPEGVSKVSELTKIKIAKTGHDDLRIRWFKLYINGSGVCLFAKHYDGGNKNGGKILDEGNQITIGKDEIEEAYSKKTTSCRGVLPSFNVDLIYKRIWLWGTLTVREDLFEELIETQLGSFMKTDNPQLYWGDKHGEKWVRCYHSAGKSRSVIHTDLDLKFSAEMDIVDLPNPEIDVDFDIEFNSSITNTNEIKIDGSVKNSKVSGELIEFYESVSSKAENAVHSAESDLNSHALSFNIPALSQRDISNYNTDIIFSYIPTRPSINISDYCALELNWNEVPQQFPSNEFDLELYKLLYEDLMEGNPPIPVIKNKSNLDVFHYWQQAGLPVNGHRGSCEFAAKFYIEIHDDLWLKPKREPAHTVAGDERAFVDYLDAYNHWKERGLMEEGRRGSREFDVQFYLNTYLDLKKRFGTNYLGAYDHWIRRGLPFEGRRGSREFDVQFFLANYPDIFTSIEAEQEALNFRVSKYKLALYKWIVEGLPTYGLRGSREFDVQYYLDRHPDLKATFDTDYTAATLHWIKTGLPDEGRSGAPEFAVRFYLDTHPDLETAFGTNYVKAHDHWLKQGLKKEGRRGSREFDVKFYLANNPDLRASFGRNYYSAFDHWIRIGLPEEGRRGSREFDVKFFLKNYPEIDTYAQLFAVTTGVSKYKLALYKWIIEGLPTYGLRGSIEFDVKYYLGKYPELKTAFGTDYRAATLHWINKGLPIEGRRGSADFDVRYYLGRYPDLQKAFGKNYQKVIDHWINFGIAEGRKGIE